MHLPKLFKILLIGDSCDDVYIYGSSNRLSPEAPVPILDFADMHITQGMAANVLNNLKAFNLDVDIVTNTEKITKTRFIDNKTQQHMLRVDTGNKVSSLKYSDIPEFNRYDLMVISDYNKGFITEELLFEIVTNSSVPIFIDSKKNKLPKNNCIIKINSSEYELLQDKKEHSNIIVTHGSSGAIYNNNLYETEKIEKGDVTGAGDTFLSALAYYYLISDHNIIESIKFANKAAHIAVSCPGTYVLKDKDIQCLMK